MRVAVLSLALLSSTAPYQCASEPDPDRRMQDTAPEALWHLAARFHEQGDAAARDDTLRELGERYPDSRYAGRAEMALGGDTSVFRPADTAGSDADEATASAKSSGEP